jgi:probable phosphoglycerate mutase
MLRSANIRNIFSTEFLRTRQTAAPTAQARHLETVSIAAKDPDALVAELRGLKGNVLIVGHSNTVPDLLKRLGIKDEIAIPDSEYDNLFIVVRPETGEPSLIRLRF